MHSVQMLIDGRLVDGARSLEVINPATEEVIAVCPAADHAQLDAAVAAAAAAFPAWAATPDEARSRALGAIADRIEAHAEELARLLTLEQGKPLANARQEVLRTAGSFRFVAGLALDETRVEEPAGRAVRIRRRPLGVVAAIVPWNFPLLLMAAKVPYALRAGNSVVLKPAPTTPLATLRLSELIADLLPPGVLNTIVDAGDLGEALTSHPEVRKISFTGSTMTGRKVMASAAPSLKRLTLELGGNDAAILLDDVDVAATAPRLFEAAFRNSGQLCAAIKRLYVPDRIYDATCEALAALADAAVVGDGLDPATQFGPLQNRAQYDRVCGLIDEAAAEGTVMTGGRTEGPGYFVRPAIVRDIADGSRLVDDEQFGPVLPLIRYGDAEEALARANASPYGLGGSIWSSDTAAAQRLAERMDCGTVWINKHAEMSPDLPFAGSKQSGFGVEMGEAGLAEFTQIQVINAAVAA